MMTKSSRVLPALLVLCGIVGCAGKAEIRRVNQAALAIRPTYTDDISRMLAANSLGMLSERAKNYKVGPGDMLEISIFEWELSEETKTQVFRVSESGQLFLPVIGEINVRDSAVGEIKAEIERTLREDGLIKDPRVSVNIKEFRSKRIAVVGAVRDPGVYTIRENVTALSDILFLAGGVSERAGQVLYVIKTKSRAAIVVKKSKSEDTVTVDMSGRGPQPAKSKTRGMDKSVISIDLYEFLEQGNLSLNMALENGDVVHVPVAKEFSVIGFVREPGSFPLRRPTTILEAIAMARGVREIEASPRYCVLKRYDARGEVIMPLDLVDISDGKKPNIYLLPNDVIDVRQTPSKKFTLEVYDLFKTFFHVGFTRSIN